MTIESAAEEYVQADSGRLLDAAVTNGPRTATLDDLRQGRYLYAKTPSGHLVKIRPPNMEIYALTGMLPARLRAMTTPSAAELNRRLTGEARTEAEVEQMKIAGEYLVEIVRLTVVEPDLSGLKTFEELDEVLLPVDFHWFLQIGQRETDYDGEGKRLWGREPLDRWAKFRELHGCTKDCAACDEFERELSVASPER